jgi:hypothetical protein
MRDFTYLSLTMDTARDERRGKPLAHNTRLYRSTAVVEGKTVDCFAVRYHATDIVKVLPDSRALLFNGGWNTVTTMQRMRQWGSNHVFSEGGNWYVWLQPNPEDPRPAYFHRTIPKPYIVSDPGPEPVKDPEGCIAGTTWEGEYEELGYAWDDSPTISKPSHLHRIKIGDNIRVEQAAIERVYYGSERYRWGGSLPAGHEYKQCPHCKAFDVVHDAWYERYNGSRWGRRFDNGNGYKLYAEMMERFGSLEAWQEGYLQDFRARRAYLKADREWVQRNRVLFFDGIIVDAKGYAPRPSKAFLKKLAAHERKVARMNKRIDKFVKLCITELTKGIPMPSGGDCWYCSMVTTDDRTPWGDSTGNHDHLLDHMREGYVVPSLLVNALRERGYKDVGIYLHLHMDPVRPDREGSGRMVGTDTMGGEDSHGYDGVKRDLRTYLTRRLIPSPPEK